MRAATSLASNAMCSTEYRLRHAERRFEKRHVVSGALGGVQPEFIAAFSVGVGFSVQCRRVQLLRRQVTAPGVAQGVGLGPLLGVGEALIARIHEMRIQPAHVLGIDQTRQAQRRRPGAVPAPGWLAFGDRAGVVALPTRGHRVEVVVHGVP